MLDFHWIKAMLFFRKYYDFLQFLPSSWYFFPAILSAMVFFRNTTAGVCINSLPISAHDISLYIAYLALVKQFRFCTIQNYLVIVKHLHHSNGLTESYFRELARAHSSPFTGS